MEETNIQRGVYMLRNLVVGDEEQHRINDSRYLGQLPPYAKQAAEYMLMSAGDHDTACAIYVRYMLEGVTPEEFKVAVKEFLVSWKEDMDVTDMEDGEVREYLKDLEEDLLGGFNKYVNQKSVNYLLK